MTKSKLGRKGLSAVFVAVAAVLALASIAYACTVFKGKMTLTAGGGTSEAVGDPLAGMVPCASPTPTSGATVTTNGTLRVQVAPASCDGTSYKLADGKFAITYFPQKNAVALLDCMNPTIPKGTGITIGTLTVSGGTGDSGNITPAASIVAKPGAEAVSVCVSNLPVALGGPSVSPAEGMLVNAGYMVI